MESHASAHDGRRHTLYLQDAIVARKEAQRQQQQYLEAVQQQYDAQQAAYLAQLQAAGVLPPTDPDQGPLAGQGEGASQGPTGEHGSPGLNGQSYAEAQGSAEDPSLRGAAQALGEPLDVEEQGELAVVSALAAADEGGAEEAVEALPLEVVAARPSRERVRVAVRVRPLAHPGQEVAAWVIDPSRCETTCTGTAVCWLGRAGRRGTGDRRSISPVCHE
jgi:hypothetical protein